MTTASADIVRRFGVGNLGSYPVIASDIIYAGSLAGDNGSGYARPLVSGDAPLVFADCQVDNSAGAAGDLRVAGNRRGNVRLPLSGVALTDVGRPVYADDDNAFSLSGDGSFIGYVDRFDATGFGYVEYDFTRGERIQVLSIPIALATVSAADVLTTFTPGFWGRVKSTAFAVGTPVTTGGDAATLNLEIGTTDVTGGAVALTSANATPLGAVIAGSAVTANNVFSPSDTISIEASSVTAFAEGDGYLLVTVGS